MRVKRHKPTIHEGDLTPMIDMTFQLIAFFMVLINFTDTEQDERNGDQADDYLRQATL